MSRATSHTSTKWAGTSGEAGNSSKRLESLVVTSERAREAREKAQQVFLNLTEAQVSPQDFIEQVQWINPEVYDDVTRERAINGFCGYPLCPQTFTDEFGSRTFIIRANKVYDITDRRNYCSDVCYEVSERVRCQMSTMPLYLRLGEETKLSHIKLPPHHQLKGQHGKLYDITGGLLNLEEVKPKQKTTFKSFSEIAQESLITVSKNEPINTEGNEANGNIEKKAQQQKGRRKTKAKVKDKLYDIVENETDDNEVMEEGCERVVIVENVADNEIKKGCEKRSKKSDTFCGKKRKSKRTSQDLEAVMETEDEEKSEGDVNVQGQKFVSENETNVNVNPDVSGVIEDLYKMSLDVEESKESPDGSESLEEIKEKSNASQRHEDPDPLLPVYEVERALREWISFESLVCVLGKQYVRGMLEHIGATWDDYHTTAGLKLGMEARSKYITLCRKMDHEERLEEETAIREAQEEDTGQGSSTKHRHPLPDYQKLQDDAKKQQLKVVSFLSGRDQYEELCSEQEQGHRLQPIPEETTEKRDSSTTLGTRQTTTMKRNPRGKKQCPKGEGVEKEEGWMLPFVDSYCQTAWRQHIVMEKLILYGGKVVGVTELEWSKVRRVLRSLVGTLDLSPHNISFTPRQWRLITVIVLRLLSIRYLIIDAALGGEEAQLMQNGLLSGFGLDEGYWARVMSYLTEITYIINKNLSSEQEAPPPGVSNTQD